MSWVRIDDAFPEHPKVVSAGPLAGWVHVCGLCYCNRNLTDGFVPRAVARRLTDFEHVGLETGGVPGQFSVGVDVDCELLIENLVAAGMWQEVIGGYIIHDYLDYNPSREEVLAARSELGRKRSAAGRKGAASRWGDSKPMASAIPGDGRVAIDETRMAPDKHGKPHGKTVTTEKQKAWQNDGPVPQPPYVPTETSNEVSSGTPQPEAKRSKDDLWEVLTEELGPVETDSERGRRNKALKELRKIGVEESELRHRIRLYRRRWPEIELTATALVANWSTFANGRFRGLRVKCPECGVEAPSEKRIQEHREIVHGVTA